MTKVYVLLPVHNRRAVTERIARCFVAQRGVDLQVVLLDDGSTDGTAEMFTGLLPTAVVVRGNGDWWWAGALQEGYRWLAARGPAAEDVVLIVNDDTEFDADFVARGVALVAAEPRTLYVAQADDRADGKLVDPGRHIDWRRLHFGPAQSPDEINCLSTRGLFMRAREFLETGGFRPHLLPHYMSDYEFTIRAQRAGWRLRTDPSLRLRVDTTTTGLHERPKVAFRKFLSLYFSRRSAGNPVTWTVFVALTCPFPWKVRHLLKIWRRAVRAIARAAFSGAR